MGIPPPFLAPPGQNSMKIKKTALSVFLSHWYLSIYKKQKNSVIRFPSKLVTDGRTEAQQWFLRSRSGSTRGPIRKQLSWIICCSTVHFVLWYICYNLFSICVFDYLLELKKYFSFLLFTLSLVNNIFK